MAKAIKLKNENYLDSSSVTHERKKLSDILYPIGSIYMSVNSTSPADLFGGTWTQIKGRFLYCTDTSKTTGGSSTTGAASGDTGSTVLTIDQIPSHRHSINDPFFKFAELTYGLKGQVFKGDKYQESTTYTEYTGGGKGHTHTLNSHTHAQNLPPHFTVYCWYREA